jgi:Ni,Fe-hydrogenase III component G
MPKTITASGALAVPVLRYSFGIINWRLGEIKKIDRKTRQILLTMHKMRHPTADMDRLHAEYLNKKYKEDQFVNIIRNHNSNQPNMSSTVTAAARIIDELSQPNENNDMKQDGIQNTKARLTESLEEKWENKVMYGQYIRSIDKHLNSKEDTFLWLSKGDLKAETESEIVAAQDQALQTKYHATEILQTEKDSKCRLCYQFEETADHIVSACPVLAKNNTSSDMIECVLNYTPTYGRN